MDQHITGVLEIDEKRGVIYFTPTRGAYKARTILRICSLPPIPVDDLLESGNFLDITHMSSTSWDKKKESRDGPG